MSDSERHADRPHLTGASPPACEGVRPARGDEDPDHWVASPCTGMCILEASDVCTGCGRTLDEITRWTGLSAAQRHAVLRAAAARHPAG